MKLLLLLLLASIASADESELAGVWSTSSAGKEPLICMCGHDFQLQITRLRDTNEYQATEYCLEHKHAVPLGWIKRIGGNLEFVDLDRKVAYKIDPDGRTLTLQGDTAFGASSPLVLKRIGSDGFRTQLAEIRSDELVVDRRSSLFPTYEVNVADPFASNEEAEQD